MITAEFDYQAPGDLPTVLQLLARDAGNTKIIAGGMSLVPMLNLGLLEPRLMISLRQVPELTGVTERHNAVVVGSMTRHHAVARDPLIRNFAPLLGMAAELIGDVQVRNRGTIGGSLAHADPAANYLPAVIALNAEVELAGPSGRRAVSARRFFLDVMATAVEPDEIIVGVSIPKGRSTAGCGFRKFTRVKGNFPIICAAALAPADDGAERIVIGGATAVPVVIDVPREAAAVQDTVAGLIRAAIENPLEDQNGDAEYKREMAVVFGLRALADARADGDVRKAARW